MKNQIFIIIVFISLLFGCWFLWNKRKQGTGNAVVPEFVNKDSDVDIKAIIIQSANYTFGYDIYVNGSVLVHQPFRPGLQGNTGFTTKEDAMKVAELVIKKLRNHEMPPTITIEEMRKLGVLNH